MSGQQAFVLGVGNAICGDDGIGPRVVDYLEQNRLDQSFGLVDVGGDGLKMLHYLNDSVEKILIVDTAFMGMNAGDYRLFSPDDVASSKTQDSLSTHGGDVIKILELGKRVGYNIPPIRIMGIEPANVSQCLEISPALQDRLPDYAKVIAEEIQRDWS